MAFDATKLHKVGGASPALFMYQDIAAVATIAASGYFNTVTDRLKQFDVILVSSATGGTPLIDVLHVTSATGAATVTTTNGT